MTIVGWIIFCLTLPSALLALAMRLYHSFFASGAPGGRRFNQRCTTAALTFGLCAGSGLWLALSN